MSPNPRVFSAYMFTSYIQCPEPLRKVKALGKEIPMRVLVKLKPAKTTSRKKRTHTRQQFFFRFSYDHTVDGSEIPNNHLRCLKPL